MTIHVGIDIAKQTHWITAINTDGVVLIDRKLKNTPASISGMIDDLSHLDEAVRVGLDVVGGIASLAEVMLVQAGFAVVDVPGLAVNRARQGTVGGEHKSDPRDARVIADQVRTRQDLRAIEPMSEIDIELRVLARRRRDLVAAQTQRLARMHDLLVSIFPGLESILDMSLNKSLVLLGRYVTPAELRAAGKNRLVRHLMTGRVRKPEVLAERALEAAMSQTIAVPVERMTARIIKELAAEALNCRARLKEIEDEMMKLLDCHPDAALIRSLPGMENVLTAEMIAEAGSISRFRSADALAAAAGVAPVLRQSGKVRFLRRPFGGNKALKRIFYQSAFCSLGHPDSRAFYDRKRREGKRHHQALLALARRRVNVLWTMLKHRTSFQTNFKQAA